MADVYDAVIVGSGFGGAVMACRLAEAGRSVAVLERGRRWDRAEFPRAIGQVAAGAFWDEQRSYGFLDYVAFRNVDVIQGAGVGGGSLHYFNVNLRTAPEVLADRRWPVAIRRETLDPYYDIALAMLGSRPLTPPPGRTALPERSSAFLTAARQAGYDAEQVPIAVYTGASRTHPLTGAQQNPCTYCGNCLFGCDIGAKSTLDTNYLAAAELRHGAAILPLHVVEAVEPEPAGGYVVRYRRLDPRPGHPAEPGEVRGRRVVLAAGALGSTGLLLSCRDRCRTLPRLGPALGTRFSLNGELLLARAHDVASLPDPGIGPPITARVTVSAANRLVTVEDLGLPDALLWYLEGALPPRLGRLRGLGALVIDYIARSIGLRGGARDGLDLEALVAGGRTPRMIPYLGMGTDSSDGQVRLRGDRLDVVWSTRRNRELYRETERVMRAISKAAGGRFAGNPLARWPLRRVLTAHPLGGCPMGDDPQTSVVNDRGEVWGYPGLFVVDGSIVPTALAVNPSLTIAALAERAAFWMLHGRELTGGQTTAAFETRRGG